MRSHYVSTERCVDGTTGNHEYDYRRKGGRKDVSDDPSGASDYHPGWGNFGNGTYSRSCKVTRSAITATSNSRP